MPDPRRAHLEGVAEALRARFGHHALIQQPKGLRPEALPTGYRRLDRRLGAGGLPRGQISLLQGVPTSGAASIALHALAQADGDPAAWFDLDMTFDPDYAARCGVDVPQLLVVRPASLASALEAFAVLADALTAALFDLRPPEQAPPDAAAWRRFLHAVRGSRCAVLCLASQDVPFVRENAAVHLRVRHERWLLRRHEVRGVRAEVEILQDRYATPGGRVRLALGGMG